MSQTGQHRPAPRRLIVLGSTGSIGVNTLDVVGHLRGTDHELDIVGLAAGRNVPLLIEQAKTFDVKHVAIADASLATQLQSALPGVTVFSGDQAALELVESVEAQELVAAVVGSAGLPATMCAAKRGMTIGLANKETLVAAGSLVTPAIRQHNAKLIPVDSEHSAIFQCLDGQQNQSIKRIVLTASGGPFREATKEQIQNATVKEALNHPTWDMGPKITIDSASMMNKALEIIEAHWLFDLPSDKIDVIIHPQSIVHSFVEFADNSILAQLGPPDMRTPIQYALTYPQRLEGCSRHMDWTELSGLTFEPPDHDRFGALKLAYEVIDAGGTAGAIFNAANEAAVDAFLKEKIRFGQITELVAQALSAITVTPVDSLETAMDADQQARDFVNTAVKKTVLM
ncbi:MAG TPA: 1-deoxy-D-xylulose-5-phosphate reductoisomerase [Phycisphaerales bacterium]|nr:1-deoxy-D-xylulose-5-phosphate reductoisomerase [Phycisphaerales bacterium]|tara:strand:+ start:8146 stop:9342 length:1197 start_codon:yes stop_codon:yes gene_type:complete